MDKREAREILADQLSRYRGRSYAELQRLLGHPETFEVQGPSGVRYQVEVEARWDGRAGGDLRLVVLIDDGGLRALAPLSDAFILAPDGRFIGE